MKLEDWIKWAERRAKENRDRADRAPTTELKTWHNAKASTYESIAWKLKLEGMKP